MSSMSRMMSIGEQDREWAEKALSNFPGTTSYGLGLPDYFEDGWKNGLSDEDVTQIILARDFLSGFPYNWSTSKSSPTSTFLKNFIGRRQGVFVYEGAVVLAALALGIPVKNYGNHHARIGIDKRSLRSMQR